MRAAILSSLPLPDLYVVTARFCQPTVREFGGSKAHDKIAHRACQWISQLADAANPSGLPRDPGGACHALALVSQRPFFRQASGERHRALDCHARTLSHVGSRGMRCVAKKQDPVLAPASQRRHIVDVVMPNLIGRRRVKPRFDRRMPASKTPLEKPFTLNGALDYACRRVCRCKPIDSLPIDSSHAEARAVAPALGAPPERRLVACRYDPAIAVHRRSSLTPRRRAGRLSI
jgi:hypothetical protein